MATINFSKKIILNDISAKRLINKIEHDKNRRYKFHKIDIQQELRDSFESLKRLLSTKEEDKIFDEMRGF